MQVMLDGSKILLFGSLSRQDYHNIYMDLKDFDHLLLEGHQKKFTSG